MGLPHHNHHHRHHPRKIRLAYVTAAGLLMVWLCLSIASPCLPGCPLRSKPVEVWPHCLLPIINLESYHAPSLARHPLPQQVIFPAPRPTLACRTKSKRLCSFRNQLPRQPVRSSTGKGPHCFPFVSFGPTAVVRRRSCDNCETHLVGGYSVDSMVAWPQ